MAYQGKRFIHQSMSFMKRSIKNVLSLEEFMFRKQVLNLYRDMTRTAYKTHQKSELMDFVRNEFASQKHVLDMIQRRYLLDQGVRQYELTCQTLGISRE